MMMDAKEYQDISALNVVSPCAFSIYFVSNEILCNILPQMYYILCSLYHIFCSRY
jgi:hypothetical protein